MRAILSLQPLLTSVSRNVFPLSFHRYSLSTGAGAPAHSSCATLEAEAVHVLREVAADFERPVMHLDTEHNFPEVIEFRDRRLAAPGPRRGAT